MQTFSSLKACQTQRVLQTEVRTLNNSSYNEKTKLKPDREGNKDKVEIKGEREWAKAMQMNSIKEGFSLQDQASC